MHYTCVIITVQLENYAHFPGQTYHYGRNAVCVWTHAAIGLGLFCLRWRQLKQLLEQVDLLVKHKHFCG